MIPVQDLPSRHQMVAVLWAVRGASCIAGCALGFYASLPAIIITALLLFFVIMACSISDDIKRLDESRRDLTRGTE